MRKNLFTLVWVCIVMLCMGNINTAKALPSCVPAGQTCSADAGIPAPSPGVVLDQNSIFTASGTFVEDPTYNISTYTYEYIITQNVDTSGNGDFADIIVGITDGGQFDFATLGQGTYTLTGVVFCQAELDAIAGNSLLGTFVNCLEVGMSFGEILDCIKSSPLGAGAQFTIQDVLDLLTGPLPGFEPLTLASIIGFTPCLDVTDAANIYTVDVLPTAPPTGPANDECAGAVGLNVGNNGPFDNTEATVGATDPAAPECFGEPTGGQPFSPELNNTTWYTFVGDGKEYHIYTSQECAGGLLPLDDDGDGLPADHYVYGGDTQMSIYTGECGTYTQVACKDDDADATSSDYFAGLDLQTEEGVTYYILIDGFNYFDGTNYYLSYGNFCIKIEELMPPPTCEANLDLLPGTALQQDACGVPGITVGYDSTTLAFAYDANADANVIYMITSANPQLQDGDDLIAFLNANSNILLQNGSFFLSNADDGVSLEIPATDNGLDPIDGAYPTLYVTAFTVLGFNGNQFLLNPACTAYSSSVQINFACEPVDCQGAFIELAANTPAEFILCPELAATFGINPETANYGPVQDGFAPFTGWILTNVDPMGDALAVPQANFLGVIPGDDLTIANDGSLPLGDYWFTAGTFFLNTADTTTSINPACFQQTTSIKVTLLGANDPACAVEPTCQANAGVQDGTGSTVAAGEVVNASGVFLDYNMEPGYIFVYVLTTDDPNTEDMYDIVGYNTDGIFQLGTPGTYHVHGLSYKGTLEELLGLMQQFGVTSGDQVAGAIEQGLICADLTIPGYELIVETSTEPLTAQTLSITDNGDGTYTVVIKLTGGNGTYTVNGDDLTGDTYTATENCGTNLDYFATDSDGHTTSGNITAPCDATPECPEITVIGDMSPLDSPFICDGGLAIASFGGTFSSPSPFAISYALHTSSTSQLGDVLALSADGIFEMPAIAEYNMGYYISLVLGNDANGDNVPDFDDCLIVTPGTPVVFLQPITQTISIDCNNVSGEYQVEVTLNGGLPAYDPTAYYTVIGDQFQITEADMKGAGSSFTFGPRTDGDSFNFEVLDGSGCSVTYQSENIACEKCKTNAGTVSTDAQILCSGSGYTPSAVGVDAGTSNAIHVFLVVSDTANYQTSSLGTFAEGEEITLADLNGGSANEQYYIVSVIGNDDNGDGTPDFDDECTVKSNTATPLVFLTPITLDAELACSNPDREGTLTLQVNGGLPAFDSNATYNVTGDFFGEVGAGETFTINGLAPATTWEVTVTDAYCDATISQSDSTCSKTVPIELLDFTGETLTEGNLIKWVTATEVNVANFEVQRSVNGIDFETVGTVQAVGNSVEANTYKLLDKTAPVGLSYYRLSTIDVDNSVAYSKTIALTRGELSFAIASISPVPATNLLDVVFNLNNAETIELHIYDITGKLVHTSKVEGVGGVNIVKLPVNALASGSYTITLTNALTTTQARFVKQ